MNATKKIVLGLVVLLFTLPAGLYPAEETDDHGTFGIAASLSQSSTSLFFPVWISPRLALEPTLSLVWVEDAGIDGG